MINPDIIKKYIANSIKNGSLPQPILNKIVDRELYLQSYQLNASNFKAFGSSMVGIVPEKLTKIVLVDNNINDESLGWMMESLSLSKNGGPQVITIIQNEMDLITFKYLKDFFKSRNSVQL